MEYKLSNIIIVLQNGQITIDYLVFSSWVNKLLSIKCSDVDVTRYNDKL